MKSEITRRTRRKSEKIAGREIEEYRAACLSVRSLIETRNTIFQNVCTYLRVRYDINERVSVQWRKRREWKRERARERERRKRKSEERKRDLSLVLVRENRRSTGIEGSFRGVPFSFRHFVSPRHERQESSIDTHIHTEIAVGYRSETTRLEISISIKLLRLSY